MTPMLVQYFTLKEEHPGALLLFRCGDFYETYGEDAVTASREMDIVLTSKDAGDGKRIEMAGIPYFALDNYLYTLIQKGYKVAICDQVEDPRKAKGLVKREVVRVVSSGTVLEPEMLDRTSHNYIASIVEKDGVIGLALADISTGDFEVTEFPSENLETLSDELERWHPAELLIGLSIADSQAVHRYCNDYRVTRTVVDTLPDAVESEEAIRSHFNIRTLMGTGISDRQCVIVASAVLLRYLRDTQKNNPLSMRIPHFFSGSEYLTIDATSTKNLELIHTIVGRERKGTLLWAIDRTETSMGARLLKNWLCHPLRSISEIESRLNAVEELLAGYDRVRSLKEHLNNISDIERLLTKAVFGTCNARDLNALLSSLEEVPHIREVICSFSSTLLQRFHHMDSHDELRRLLSQALEPSPPATLRDGNIIKEGFHRELDELRNIRRNAREWISRYEDEERSRTGIKSLKVGFNQVFGYYIEVTRTNLKMVPEDYIRKQTIANGERFFSPELKEYETKVLSADERIKNLEYELFSEIRNEVVKHAETIQQTAQAVSVIDVIAGFACNAREFRYCRPEVSSDNILDIKEGRHPVIEKISGKPFVKNDLFMDGSERVNIITGPNMSGKSTYLRQTALITIMAQMGSFVPAKSSRIGVIDRIFTRVGATDDLHLGQSTFMVEMLETSNIINNATESSLVILDEIGRGTSTFDGLSIAWAVVEHLYQKVKAKTLFATHFHELTTLARKHPGIKNRRVAVKETHDEVIFLHRIVSGASDKSYGIYVAKLAGFPEETLNRAQEILEKLEGEKRNGAVFERPEERSFRPVQLTFFEESQNPIIDEIRKVNIIETTPLQALNKIYKWQRSIERFKASK